MPTPEPDAHFLRAFELTLGHEGGVSRDRKDRAGDGSGRPHTNFGITLRTIADMDARADAELRAFLHAEFDVDKDGDIDFDDVPLWTRESALKFYRLCYWRPISADSFPLPIAILLFDAAVNMGKSAAVKTLQRALEVTDDGVVGPKTIAAARRHAASDLFLGEMLARRLDACRTFPTAPDHFLGWARRCFSLHLEALKGDNQ